MQSGMQTADRLRPWTICCQGRIQKKTTSSKTSLSVRDTRCVRIRWRDKCTHVRPLLSAFAGLNVWPSSRRSIDIFVKRGCLCPARSPWPARCAAHQVPWRRGPVTRTRVFVNIFQSVSSVSCGSRKRAYVPQPCWSLWLRCFEREEAAGEEDDAGMREKEVEDNSNKERWSLYWSMLWFYN